MCCCCPNCCCAALCRRELAAAGRRAAPAPAAARPDPTLPPGHKPYYAGSPQHSLEHLAARDAARRRSSPTDDAGRGPYPTHPVPAPDAKARDSLESVDAGAGGSNARVRELLARVGSDGEEEPAPPSYDATMRS